MFGNIRAKMRNRNTKGDARLKGLNKKIWIFDGLAAYALSVQFTLVAFCKFAATFGFGLYMTLALLGFIGVAAVAIGVVLRLKRWSNYNYGAIRLLVSVHHQVGRT